MSSKCPLPIHPRTLPVRRGHQRRIELPHALTRCVDRHAVERRSSRDLHARRSASPAGDCPRGVNPFTLPAGVELYAAVSGGLRILDERHRDECIRRRVRGVHTRRDRCRSACRRSRSAAPRRPSERTPAQVRRRTEQRLLPRVAHAQPVSRRRHRRRRQSVSGRWCRLTRTSRTPWAASQRRMRATSGAPATGSAGLARSQESGRRRVPSPRAQYERHGQPASECVEARCRWPAGGWRLI